MRMVWLVWWCSLALAGIRCGAIHGRYTRDVENYDLLVPRKVTANGNFLTYSIPHYYQHNAKRTRSSRTADDNDMVHYGLSINGKNHHLELWPNHDLVSPHAIVEYRSSTDKVKNKKIDDIAKKPLCHFTGKIRGVPDSSVALSTCDGLAGYVSFDGRKYYVEPLHEHQPNKRGQHLHVIYERHVPQREKRYQAPHCGTSEDWREAWKKRLREDTDWMGEERQERKRGLNSVQRYLETLVVADKQFLHYHKNTDYELYIMTIMNMVSDYYHDSSSGNQMDVVVVRLMYLEKEEEEIDLAISQDSDKTLASFCKWQQSVNPADINNPNHHDIAVLLTRYDICADNMANCGLMGLAFVASACSGDKPCAINEDAGLILGIVVAHEIGHVMGCSHDKEDESGCKPQAEDTSYYIMSPFVHLHTNVWSSCSRGFMTTFFDNDLGECLNDEPQISLFQDKNMLPGAIYDAKWQCQLDYPGSKVCQVDPEKFCERLLCRTDPTTCMSSGEPPADGTKCGENKWCYNLKCVEIGERPEAVNGGWGDWGAFSACSRTCGGGVSIAERECDNPRPQHKGRYCLGDRKKVKICQPQPCPDRTPTFRTIQCTEFDAKPFQGKLYRWKPYMKADDPCSLYCINQDSVYVKLAPRAKDGTPCKAGTRNMCVGGVCRVVGCDNVLDSDAAEDECGVCKGDGTECKIVDRVFQAPPGHGYVKVAIIFRGSRNVIIEELKPSVNTIAITGPDEKTYYLNGGNTEEVDGTKQIGPVEGIYSHPEPNKETLVIHGPLQENIVFYVVFYQNENVGYQYKYSEPAPKSTYQPTYHWEFVDWEECSVRCGGGVEISESKCIEEKTGLVSSTFCQAFEKPHTQTRTCNEQACVTKWRLGRWSACVTCKNSLSGMRSREVECVREAKRAGEEDVLIEDNGCNTKKPASKELCHVQAYCKHKKRCDLDVPADIMNRVWLQSVAHAPEADLKVMSLLGKTKNRRGILRNMRRFGSHKQFDKNQCGTGYLESTNASTSSTTSNPTAGGPSGGGTNAGGPSGGGTNAGSTTTAGPNVAGPNTAGPNAGGAPVTESTASSNTNESTTGVSETTTSSPSGGNGNENTKNQTNNISETSSGNATNTTGGAEHKGEHKNATSKLKVGSIVKDTVDEEGLKVIAIPVKQSHGAINISDKSFETMGDRLPDTLDVAHERVFKGEKAANIMKHFHHTNITGVETT